MNKDLFRFIIEDYWVMLFDSFVGDFEQVYVQCVKSAVLNYIL